VLLVEGLKRL